MKIGVIADDFTGASDIALTLAEGGMEVAQFVGIPCGAAEAGLDGGVVALKSRTAPVDEAVAQSLAACDWLLDQGAEQIVFKVCSTFDSTAGGNIGPVLDALATRLGAGPVIVCPAFPETGRSVYQGHLFVGDRLLSESGMKDHPLTPMTNPDLRQVLAAQSIHPVGHVPAATVMAGPKAIASALPASGHIIVDAITNDDLRMIGAAAKGAPLICGGSGIALGLPANFDLGAATPKWQGVPGSGVVLSGSCSRATREQVMQYRNIAPARLIAVEDVLQGGVGIEELADWVVAQDEPPLVYSSADPAKVAEAQALFGREASATAFESLFASLATALVARGVTRIVVAGGETSGAVVSGLGTAALHIGPRIAPGVPALRVSSPAQLALALKSGNFGGPDFFAEALHQLERSAQ